MPPKAKANFKTYEASTRLLAALLVSIQGKVKLNFDGMCTQFLAVTRFIGLAFIPPFPFTTLPCLCFILLVTVVM